ncbi:MAG: DUF1549 domain-containing protein [Verrucomicrobiales bacterium]|nr:DUF1549 domain-containing protein [Verrucomicrobiales bacterium]
MKPILSSVLLFVLIYQNGFTGEPGPAEKIDQLVEATLKKQGITPNAAISDPVFLRRVYLNIAGRVPTIEESEAFHTNSYPNKRERLIDELIHGEAHVSHAYHFWGDLLRLNGEPNRGALANAYELWVKEAIRSNMPYDKMVYSLVTAEGKFWENGAVGYYFRDRGMPLDNMSNTVRVFLGTRLECAQCHNHPFDKWTQMDYFKMASFSYGMNSRNYDAPNRDRFAQQVRKSGEVAYMAKAKELTGKDDFPYMGKPGMLEKYLERVAEDSSAGDEAGPAKPSKRATKRKKRINHHESLGMTADEFANVVRQCIAAGEANQMSKETGRAIIKELYDPLQYTSVSAGDRNAKLPHDYQYSDAKPNQEIPAETMFGADIDLSQTDSKIQAYGKWMTSPENPTFTRVIVNRLWKEVFGIGIFEPVDELTDHTYLSNPELLNYLEKLMIDLQYDQKAFQQVLYNTQTYQRESFKGELEMGAPFYFQGPVLRRMSAEQIWDSLVALALPEADRYQPKLKSMLSSIDRVKRIYQSLEERPYEEYAAMIEELAPLIGQRKQTDDENRKKLEQAKASGDEDAFRRLRQEIGSSRKELANRISDVAYIHLNEKVDAGELMLAMGVMDVGFDALMDDESPENSREIVTSLPKPEFKKKSFQSEERKKDRDRAARKEAQREMMADYNIYRKLISGMARASELASPAPRGHFLRDFGQSDREVIENASDHASVPQALNLLNGQIVESLTNPYSTFGKRLEEAGTPEEKAKMIFQAMLTREPTESEMELVKAEVESSGDKSYEGIVWALLNTRQFMFIQ